MRLSLFATLAATCLAAAEAHAGCADPETQAEMTACAGEMYQAADKDLNLAWKRAMQTARTNDANAGLAPGEVPSAEMLREAQRAWIGFRDKACAAEATLVRGGSMEPMIELDCLARLTRARAGDLWYFAQTN